MYRCQPTAAIIAEPITQRHHAKQKRHERTMYACVARKVASPVCDVFFSLEGEGRDTAMIFTHFLCTANIHTFALTT